MTCTCTPLRHNARAIDDSCPVHGIALAGDSPVVKGDIGNPSVMDETVPAHYDRSPHKGLYATTEHITKIKEDEDRERAQLRKDIAVLAISLKWAVDRLSINSDLKVDIASRLTDIGERYTND